MKFKFATLYYKLYVWICDPNNKPIRYLLEDPDGNYTFSANSNADEGFDKHILYRLDFIMRNNAKLISAYERKGKYVVDYELIVLKVCREE